MDVATAVIDYLGSIKHLAARTQSLYQHRLSLFADWCEENDVGLERVNNRTVQSFLAWVGDNRKPRRADRATISTHTLHGFVQSIWSFLYWCRDDEEYSAYVRHATIKGIKPPRLEHKVVEAYTTEEILALFEACKMQILPVFVLRDTAIIALLVDTGIRAEELGTLTIGNVTIAQRALEDNYIKVMGKGRKEREIPIGSITRRALNRYMREYRAGAHKSEPVFLTRNKNAMNARNLHHVMARLKALSTLPAHAQVNPHKFRHTFAAMFMESGGDVYDLSRLLGHSSVSMTENYLKSLSPKAVRTRKSRLSVLDNL